MIEWKHPSRCGERNFVLLEIRVMESHGGRTNLAILSVDQKMSMKMSMVIIDAYSAGDSFFTVEGPHGCKK
jgi:hypothetical protein